MDLEKRIEELMEIIKKAKVKDAGKEVFELAIAYATDSLYFLKNGKRDEALEAYSIAWAYIDALLHLGLVKVPRRFKKLFTVE